MRNRTYGGVRGRKTKVGRKLLRFPPTRLTIGDESGRVGHEKDPLKMIMKTLFWVIVKSTYKYLFFV